MKVEVNLIGSRARAVPICIVHSAVLKRTESEREREREREMKSRFSALFSARNGKAGWLIERLNEFRVAGAAVGGREAIESQLATVRAARKEGGEPIGQRRLN